MKNLRRRLMDGNDDSFILIFRVLLQREHQMICSMRIETRRWFLKEERREEKITYNRFNALT